MPAAVVNRVPPGWFVGLTVSALFVTFALIKNYIEGKKKQHDVYLQNETYI